jgi:hypothetical protein
MMQHDPKPPGTAFFLVSSGFTLRQDGKMSPGSFGNHCISSFPTKVFGFLLNPLERPKYPMF